MKFSLILQVILFIYSSNVSADVFGGDLLILSEIAMSAAKEAKATLELLDVAEKTQDNISKANRQFSTYKETTLRAERLANRAARLAKMRINNNAQLNEELRKIKYSVNETKRLQARFEKNYGTTFEAKEKIQASIDLPEVDKKSLDTRLSVSETTSSAAGHAQNTALNTALTNQLLYENFQNQNLMMKEQLEYFNEQRERNIELDRRQSSERKFLGIK